MPNGSSGDGNRKRRKDFEVDTKNDFLLLLNIIFFEFLVVDIGKM